MTYDHLTTWLEIDLGAIRSNIHQLQKITQKPIMAIVKANGYGHGLVESARAAQQAGCGWCGVARIEEALALRQAGLTLNILVLGYTAPPCAAEAAAHRISLAVYDLDVAQAYAAKASAGGTELRVHAKFDSGMARLGVFPEDGLPFMQQLHAIQGLSVEGMFTHFARSDEPERTTTAWQNGRFSALVKALTAAGLRPPLVHAANSAAALYFPEAYYDMVRCGISIYGLHPSASEARLPEGFIPALTWKARLSSVKIIPAHHGVGYAYRYTTQKEERIGVVTAGYADGMRRRHEINAALVGGRRVPVVGGVCMDQIMLQLDTLPNARIGDEVVLIGRQGEATLAAEDLAQAWGTVNYDVVCGLTARVPRIYHE